MTTKSGPDRPYTPPSPLQAGTLLAACPFLSDAPFRRRLLLLAEHGLSGSVGFVLNDYSGYRLGELLPGFEGWDIPVWTGGPVERDTLHIVQIQSPRLAECDEMVPGIWWNAQPAEVMRLAGEGLLESEKWFFFLGYAGWSPGQLESEFGDHYWISGPYQRALMPREGSATQWSDFLDGLGAPFAWLSRAPMHPSMN